jgi:hypothetical protein
MNKTAKDWVFNRAKELAKEDSQNAGGWEAVDDLASLKLQYDPIPYIIAALLEYLDTVPEPLEALRKGRE